MSNSKITPPITVPGTSSQGADGSTNFGYEGDKDNGNNGDVELEQVISNSPQNYNNVSKVNNEHLGSETAAVDISNVLNPIPSPLAVNNGNKCLETNEERANIIAKYLVKFRTGVRQHSLQHKQKLQLLLVLLFGILYNIYVILAINYNATHEMPLDWCNGLGFLIILTVIVYLYFFYSFILKRYFGQRIKTSLLNLFAASIKEFLKIKYIRLVISLLAIAGLITFLVIDTWDHPRGLISALGVFILIALGFLVSKHPAKVKWSQLIWAIGLQFVMALLILRWSIGRNVLNCVSSKATKFLNFATSGSDFVYGYLSSGKPTKDITFDSIFAFKALSVIFYFGFCISLFYHYGAMQWVISKMGWILQITIGTTAAESINASANIFLGMLESPLLIKPFLGKMTNSEIHTIMTSGFATVAGATFAAYITFGVNASYIISATVLASFCSLGYSKLVYPETCPSQTKLDDINLIQTKGEGSAIDAAAQGAMQGVTLVGCVVANVIAFVSFVTFLNAVIWWFGSLVGVDDLSFELILGKVFIPLAWIMGIDPEECESVALLLGLKTVTNEFIAYQRLVNMSLSPRSRAIASFALCSFANVGSVGISLGGLSALVPERRLDFGKVMGRAFFCGTIVGFLNGCFAGILLNEPGYAAWKENFTMPNITTT